MRDFTKENLENKVVLLRLDINLPIVDGKITDYTRLKKILPSVNQLISQRAKIVIISHFGRPKGKFVKEMSMRPIFEALCRELEGTSIFFCENVNFLKKAIDSINNGDIIFLENIRFYKEEEEGSEDFAKLLASFGDYFINDAFSCCHRNHASISLINKYLPSAPGILLRQEIEALNRVLNSPDQPTTAIIGGSKISTKIDLLSNLIDKFNNIIIGGAMANNFLYAMDIKIGRSLLEREYIKIAEEILSHAKDKNCKIILPIDAVVADEFSTKAIPQEKDLFSIAENDMILDIGSKTQNLIKEIITTTKTLIWNGPLGAYELPQFASGSIEIAKAIAENTRNNSLVSVAGGGDVVAAINLAEEIDSFTYISTAGGAFLEWLEGKKLPGIEALLNL